MTIYYYSLSRREMAKAPFQRHTIQPSSKQVGVSGTTYILVLSKKTEGVPSKLPSAQSTSNLSMKPSGPKVSLNVLAPPASGVVTVTH